MEAEFFELSSSSDWRCFFDQICAASRNLGFTTTEASKFENKGLNRYRDVYPFDHSRVLLTNVPTTDYINASLVQVERVKRRYILAQGPLPATTSHFWSMVWEKESRAVIMLNRVVEKGANKCHQYWPEEEGGVVECEDVGLSVECLSSVPGENYTTARMRIVNSKTGEVREVTHFHYTTWPDFGVPSSPDAFLEFLAAVRESGSLEAEEGPAVVHCSAGIGRSGTFCLVDSCLLMAEMEGTEVVSVKEVLVAMRRYRMGLIQTQDQLKFSYVAILEGARQMGLLEGESVVAEASDSETDDEDDIPPPLPPPRGEANGYETPPPLPPPRGASRNPGEVFGMKLIKQEDENENGDPEIVTLEDVKDKRSIVGKDAEPFNSLPCKLRYLKNCDSIEDIEKMVPIPEEVINVKDGNKEEEEPKFELRKRVKEENGKVHLKVMEEFRSDLTDWRKVKHLKETLLPFGVGLAMFLAGGYYYFN